MKATGNWPFVHKERHQTQNLTGTKAGYMRLKKSGNPTLIFPSR